MTGVLRRRRRETRKVCGHREKGKCVNTEKNVMWEHEKLVNWKPRRKASGETKSGSTLILDFQPLELWDKFLSFKLPNLWHFFKWKLWQTNTVSKWIEKSDSKKRAPNQRRAVEFPVLRWWLKPKKWLKWPRRYVWSGEVLGNADGYR